VAQRAPGRVILLNGAPSCGKTTIARALWNAMDEPYWYHSLDEFRKGYTERHWDRTRGPWSAGNRELFNMLVEGFLGSVRAMALSGHNVITEAVVLPMNIDLYREALDGLDVLVVGVRCPIDIAEERERARAPADRHLGVPIPLRVPEFDLVHANGRYDVEFDTSVTSVDDAVAMIRAALVRPAARAFTGWVS
jgi:chloramphenicol 3-O phosphotransferase